MEGHLGCKTFDALAVQNNHLLEQCEAVCRSSAETFDCLGFVGARTFAYLAPLGTLSWSIPSHTFIPRYVGHAHTYT